MADPQAPIRVLVVDDHQVFASSMRIALDSEPDLSVVGVANTLEQARRLVSSEAPDIALLDYRMPDGDGVAAIAGLRSLRPSIQVVMLSASTSESLLVAAIEAGATGFIPKSAPLEEVLSAVRAAAAGEAVINAALLSRLLPRLRRNAAPSGPQLTARERDILGFVAQGKSNAAIAEELTLSVFTVRNHVTNLCAKLGAHSKLEALSIAIRDGLLSGS